jgi:hypothetical protein
MTFNDQLQWLITMARTPGWKAYAWHRAKEMAADDSGLWPEIDKRLEEAMRAEVPGETRSQG